MILTPEAEKGTKFEIWLEELLHDFGYKPRRNVEFHKRRCGHRQIDLIYNIVKEDKVYLAMIEAKYCSNGVIPNKLRSPKDIKIGQLSSKPIDNIIDDLVERYQFIEKYFFRFDYVFLVTNKSFDNEIKSLAPRNNITVVENKQLSEMHIKRNEKTSIDDSIKQIDYRGYVLSPTNEYTK